MCKSEWEAVYENLKKLEESKNIGKERL